MSSSQPERITPCLAKLHSHADEDREIALRTLTSLTKVNPQNRTFLAQSEGVIPILLALSKSPSAVIQKLALSVIFNVSLNPELKLLLANTKTISALNSVIVSATSSPESTRLAASLICSLAMLDKNKAQFGASGTVPILVAAVSEPQTLASHHLLSSLAELVRFHGNSTLAVRSGAVPVLMRVMTWQDDGISGTALAVMSLLARFDEGLRAVRGTEGVVERLAGVLGGQCVLGKEGAAEILVRLFEESEACVRDALKVPGFAATLADLSVSGSAKTRESVTKLMGKIMEADFEASGPLLGI